MSYTRVNLITNPAPSPSPSRDRLPTVQAAVMATGCLVIGARSEQQQQ